MIRIISACLFLSILSSFGGFDKATDSLDHIGTNYKKIGNISFIAEEWIDISGDHSVHVIRQREMDEGHYLSIGGQLFYPFSWMSADVNFSNGALDVSFEDINDDGYSDLIINGTVNYKGTDEVEQESVLFIYLCDPKAEKFVLKFKKATFDIHVENDALNQWKKRGKGVRKGVSPRK